MTAFFRIRNHPVRAIPWLVLLLVLTLTILHFPYSTDPPASQASFARQEDAQAFYDKAYESPGANKPGDGLREKVVKSYGAPLPPAEVQREYSYFNEIVAFVDQYKLHDKRVLEVGAGAGLLQDIVPNYTGLDLSATAHTYFHKPFVQASATSMPFKDSQFDVIWTINTLEHVPHPEHALGEMRRVLKNDAILYLSPAWDCRPWSAQGYKVRSYSDFDWRGKLIKASVPIRNFKPYRATYIFPIRFSRWLYASLSGSETAFRYTTLTPNFTYYWTADADAVNSMDAYEAILWFRSRGDELLYPAGPLRQFLVRNNLSPLIVRIRKHPS
jgi:SAM-dependent methyltransferase